MERILYVEDDPGLIDGLQYTLEAGDMRWTMPGRSGRRWLCSGKMPMICCCWMSRCRMAPALITAREVRRGSTVPIIFLTASDQEISIVKGLDMGGDDYITKPFRLNELLSRIKALLRRSGQFSRAESVLEANGIRVDTAERLVWKHGKQIELSLVEYRLLCLFMKNPNHLLTRELILDRMWEGTGIM